MGKFSTGSLYCCVESCIINSSDDGGEIMRQRLFVAVLLVIALTIGACFWYIKSQAFTTSAANVIAGEITRTLDTRVDIASVTVDSPTTLALTNVTIQDKMGTAILESGRIEVSFSPLAVLMGESVVKSISQVEIDSPEVNLVRRNNQEWNYMDFMNSDEKSELDFYGKVKFSQAIINVEIDKKRLKLEDISGSLDLANQPSIHFDIIAKQADGDIKFNGVWGGKNKAVSVEANNFTLDNYLEFLPEEFAIQVNSGKLTSFKATVTSDDNGNLKVNGEALLLGISLTVEKTEVDHIDGFVLFNESEIRIFSRGQIAKQPIVLKGTTDLNMIEPMLNLELSSKSFDVTKVLENFPVKGTFNFVANIQGNFKEPLITGNFSSEELIYQEYIAHNVVADLRFGDDVLYIDSLTTDLCEGKANIQGEFNTKTEKYGITLMGKNINLDLLPEYNQGLSGYMDLDVRAKGQGLNDINNVIVSGKTTVHDGSYAGVNFTGVDAGFYKDANYIAVDYVNVNLPQGQVTLTGQINEQNINLVMQGNNVALAQFLQNRSEFDLSGNASFHGNIRGTLEAPTVFVNVLAENGSLLYQPYQKLTGILESDFETINIKNIEMTDGISTHKVQGSIGLKNENPLNLTVVSTQARAENLIKILLPGEDLTGNIDNTVVLRGTLENIDAEGNIFFNDGSYRGMLLREAHGKYKRKDGVTSIEDFSISSPNLNVKISGLISAGNALDFDIIADDIDLVQLKLNLPYKAEGKAKFVGKLKGHVDNPNFYGTLTADRTVFNQNELRNINGKIRYANDEIELDSFNFMQGDGSFDLSANFNLSTKRVRGDLVVKNSDVAGLLEILNVKQDWLFGKLNGDIHLEGSTEKPKVRINGTIENGFLKKYPLDDVSLDVFVDGRVINIEKFYAKQGQGILVAKGTADLDGDLNFEVAGQSIHAALLTDLMDLDIDTKGTLDFGSQVFGTASSPKANLSMEIKGGGIGGATFDSLYGMCTLNEGIIDVQQILLTKGEYKASAYGIVPLAALTKTDNVDVKEQMNLKVSLDQADLSILPFLTKEIEWGRGNTNGNLVITGSLLQPLINGNITVNDGTLKLKHLGKPIQKMAVDIQFLNDRIDVQTFDGVMGDGSYQLRGRAFIGANGLKDYSLTLNLNDLDIVNKYYTGPLNGLLSLEDDKGVPKVVGNVDLANCTVDIPMLPDTEDGFPNVKLDVTVNAGKKVRLYNSMLYDILVEGHANFSGSTQHPRASGEFSAIRGNVNYLKTSFKIREGTVLFNQAGSFIPSIRLSSDTQLQRTKIYLDIDGPVSNMQVKLYSNPELSEQEILSLLTLRSAYDSKEESGIGKDELNAIVNLGLSASFFSELENIAKSALGVDEFNVVRDTLSYTENGSNYNREVYNLEIGKYVTDKMMLKYTTGIDHEDYYFGIRYDFSNRISFTSDIDQDNNKRFGIEARFKF